MLAELKIQEFERIRPLLAGERVNMEIKGVAAGNNPGWVFVDNPNKPQTALVFAHGQKGFYFLGRENQPQFAAEVPRTIADLRPRLAVLGIDEFEYSGTSLLWDETLAKLFADNEPQEFRQHVYTFPDLQKAPLPESGEDSVLVEELTPELLARTDLDKAAAETVLLEWWESLEKFFSVGSGYCVVWAGQIVSLCYTSYVAGPTEWELGVDTLGDFRQRGYGKLATLAMLRKCREKGVIPYWDCMETNTPSRRLATGVGFSLAFTYQVYWFPLN